MVEENEPLVIDIGTGALKAGFASDDAPKYNIPMVVGIPDKTKGLLVGMDQKDAYIGYEALDKANLLDMYYPVQKGVITNMEKIKQILDHLVTTEMSISLDEHAVMMTEPPSNPKKTREEIVRMMFEGFNVPKFYLGCQAVLSLFATGKTTGTVLDSGEGVTHTVPIFEGYAIPHAITPIPICGSTLTKYMLDLIKKKESPSGSDRDLFLMAENFKCLYGEVALDYDAQLKQARDTTEPETYVLPSGTKLVRSYREERLMCPEQLFQPKENGTDAKGIHNYTFDSIMKCDQDIKKELFRNIVMAGGSTMFKGMQKRMKKEIQALAPSTMGPEVETPADRKHSCWLGGAILSKIEKFESMWITKKEWEDRGDSIVHEKCF